MYNLTNITSANDMYGIITSSNDLVGGGLISAIMFVVWLLILISYKKENFKIVLIAASFMMIILGALAFTMGWIGLPVLLTPVILTLASLFMYYFVD